jgi:prevent-host-death family protein
MTSTVSAVELRSKSSDLLDRAKYHHERLVVTRNSKAWAAIVSLDDVKLLEWLEDCLDAHDAERAMAEVEREGALDWDEVRARTGR